VNRSVGEDCGLRGTRSSQARDAWLLSRLDVVHRKGCNELVLDRRDVEELARLVPNSAPLPSAFSVLATLAASSWAAADRGEFLVHVPAFAGPSGARPLGRFCHADEELLAHVASHLRDEEAADPEALYAEVVHLPEGRIGNVLARPILRSHEIVYLGDSGVPRDRQILASDLLVSVEASRVVLRDRTTGRRVVPRLTSAHNFKLGVPVYRFLCLLQNQGVAYAGAWRWGALDGAPSLPRVRVGRIVLSLARWRVRPDEVREWNGKSGPALRDVVRRWRARRGIPSRVAIMEDDNALPVDLDTPMGAAILHHLVKDKESPPVLEELFAAEDTLCVEGPEGKFTNELIVPFVCPRNEASPSTSRSAPAVLATTSSAPRTFTPGSEWLYVKLYSGRTTSDRVLRRLVSPLIQQARERGWMDRWFFVRYADPEWHLRLRFRGAPDVLLRELLPAIHSAAHPLFADGSLWRLQIDTYVREIERYGGAEGIDLAESIFEADSDAVVQLVDSLGRGADPGDRWRLALAGIDRLIADFGFDLAARREIAVDLRNGFAREWKSVPHQHRRFGERFRQERALLERIEFESADLSPVLRRGLDVLRARSETVEPLVTELRMRESAQRLTQPLVHVVGSFVHMHANRLLRAAQRPQEAILYDFLGRLYDARAARSSSRGGDVPSSVSQNETMTGAD
jgi:thiopeptide-type bacteriocin biosynthesis protein